MFTWLNGSPTTPPILLKFRSSKIFIILTVATAVFTDIFLYGIIVPVLPYSLRARVGIREDVTQRWISIFLAVYGAALLTAAPICGWFADRSTSRRVPMIVGLFLLGGATVILCLARSIAVLAVGRVLQGISASVPWVVGLALIVDTVGPDGVGQAMGYVGLSLSFAMLLAPLLGGVVFHQAGYYAVFAMAFGLIILDIFLRVVMIEKKVAVRWLPEQPSEPESVDPTAVIEGDTVEMEKASDQERRPEMARNASVISTRSAADDILPANTPNLLRRIASHLPPVVFLLGSRRLLSAIFGCLIQATLYTAFDTILPLYVRNTFHWNSTGAGLIFLPLVIVSFIGPVFGRLSDKHGPRWYATAGYVLACPFLILLRLVDSNTLGQKVLLCALLALIGFCLTSMLTPMMAEITYAVNAKAERRPPGFFGKNGAYAQAYGLFNVAWAGGCMVGPLLAGLVTQSHGWSDATLTLGCISIFTAIPIVIFTGGSIFRKSKTKQPGSEVQTGEQALKVP